MNIDKLSDFTSESARKYGDATRETLCSSVHWLGGPYAKQTGLTEISLPTSLADYKEPKTDSL